MRNTLTIIFSLLCFTAISQAVSIGSKSFSTSFGVTLKDSSVDFKPSGYADYTVSALKEGIYKFTARVINNAKKPAYIYLWSAANTAWSSALMPAKTTYQSIPVKVTLNKTTNFVRLYFTDSASLDGMKYELDSAFGIDLTPILSRISILEQKAASLQAQIDTMPPIFIVPGYGIKTNPIKP